MREANIVGFKTSWKEKTWCFTCSFLILNVLLYVLGSNVCADRHIAWAHNCWQPKCIFWFCLLTNTKLHIQNINWNYNVLLPVSFVSVHVDLHNQWIGDPGLLLQGLCLFRTCILQNILYFHLLPFHLFLFRHVHQPFNSDNCSFTWACFLQ